MTIPPILRDKAHDAPSVFMADALLREARRQKRISAGNVPEACFLDPDGDILRHLKATKEAKLSAEWACYHTELYRFDRDGTSFGIVACVVGASFAVLVAEELFASGCKLVISMTSAGQIVPVQAPPYFVIIDRALRDEGTSYHYLPAADYSLADAGLISLAQRSLAKLELSILTGATWTTDAPFRETADAIAMAREAGLLAVEMEAAALYAFARARERPVLCFAHVTNQMGVVDGDFEKGIADGAQDSLAVLVAVARACLAKPSSRPEADSLPNRASRLIENIETIEGGCLCGAVRFAATSRPKGVFWCHCQSCRRHSGAPVSVFVGFEHGTYAVTKGEITKFSSFAGTTRGFCSKCGSTLTCEVKALPTETHFHVGALDTPERFEPGRHFFRDEQLPWLHLSDTRT